MVKILRFERLKDWKSLELFEREASVLRGLSHPNIPAYIDDFSLGDKEHPEAQKIIRRRWRSLRSPRRWVIHKQRPGLHEPMRSKPKKSSCRLPL